MQYDINDIIPSSLSLLSSFNHSLCAKHFPSFSWIFTNRTTAFILFIHWYQFMQYDISDIIPSFFKASSFLKVESMEKVIKRLRSVQKRVANLWWRGRACRRTCNRCSQTCRPRRRWPSWRRGARLSSVRIRTLIPAGIKPYFYSSFSHFFLLAPFLSFFWFFDIVDVNLKKIKYKNKTIFEIEDE